MDAKTSRKSEDQVRPRATVLLQCINGPENVRKATWVGVFIFIRSGMRVQHLKVYILRVFRYVLNWHQRCEKSKPCSGLLIDSLDRSPHANLHILICFSKLERLHDHNWIRFDLQIDECGNESVAISTPLSSPTPSTCWKIDLSHFCDEHLLAIE